MKAERRGQESYRSYDKDSKSLGSVVLKMRWRDISKAGRDLVWAEGFGLLLNLHFLQ